MAGSQKLTHVPRVKAGALGVGPANPWARLLGTVPRGVFSLHGKPVSCAADLLPLCCVSSTPLSRLPFPRPLPWFPTPTVTEDSSNIQTSTSLPQPPPPGDSDLVSVDEAQALVTLWTGAWVESH